MLDEIWNAIRRLKPAAPEAAVAWSDDEEDEPLREVEKPSFAAQEISGTVCVIRYVDTKGHETQRRVSCQRLDLADTHLYLVAYCHERQKIRQFRIDRVRSVVDLSTGEIVEPGLHFFERFGITHIQKSGLTWGLSVRQRADVLAGLNVLAFLAQCDGGWHPAEREAVESFVTAYWMRAELRGEPPIEDIMARCNSLAPDPETFYVSLSRCEGNKRLASALCHWAAELIAADDVVHKKEDYWGGQMIAYLDRAAKD